MRWIQHLRRDFTQFEFSVTMVLLVALVGLTIHKLTALEAAAEHASFTATVNRLKSVVMLEALTRVVRNDQGALVELEQLNPMELMAHPPLNYGGVVDADVGLESGAWYFDRSQEQLLYVFYRRPRGRAGGRANDRRRFRVRLLYDDRDEDGEFVPGVDAFTGVTLELVHPPATAVEQRRSG